LLSLPFQVVTPCRMWTVPVGNRWAHLSEGPCFCLHRLSGDRQVMLKARNNRPSPSPKLTSELRCSDEQMVQTIWHSRAMPFPSSNGPRRTSPYRQPQGRGAATACWGDHLHLDNPVKIGYCLSCLCLISADAAGFPCEARHTLLLAGLFKSHDAVPDCWASAVGNRWLGRYERFCLRLL
jgi:hypothetical protein